MEKLHKKIFGGVMLLEVSDRLHTHTHTHSHPPHTHTSGSRLKSVWKLFFPRDSSLCVSALRPIFRLIFPTFFISPQLLALLAVLYNLSLPACAGPSPHI